MGAASCTTKPVAKLLHERRYCCSCLLFALLLRALSRGKFGFALFNRRKSVSKPVAAIGVVALPPVEMDAACGVICVETLRGDGPVLRHDFGELRPVTGCAGVAAPAAAAVVTSAIGTGGVTGSAVAVTVES